MWWATAWVTSSSVADLWSSTHQPSCNVNGAGRQACPAIAVGACPAIAVGAAVGHTTGRRPSGQHAHLNAGSHALRVGRQLLLDRHGGGGGRALRDGDLQLRVGAKVDDVLVAQRVALAWGCGEEQRGVACAAAKGGACLRAAQQGACPQEAACTQMNVSGQRDECARCAPSRHLLLPLSCVPLVLPRSTRYQVPPAAASLSSQTISACLEDTEADLKKKVFPVFTRPSFRLVIPGLLNSSPGVGPAIIVSEKGGGSVLPLGGAMAAADHAHGPVGACLEQESI